MRGHASREVENTVMDALMEFPQSASDLADELHYHLHTVRDCIRGLRNRGLIQAGGMSGKHVIWTMARTSKAA